MRLLTLILLLLVTCATLGTTTKTALGSSKRGCIQSVTHAQATPTLERIRRFGAWWGQPKQPIAVQQHLPAARPMQPWPYRALDTAVHASITTTDSYALEAIVSHAPLKGGRKETET